MQRELDRIYNKIMTDFKTVTSKEVTRLVELINQRLTYKDPIICHLTREELIRNFDYITRATYELTKGGLSRSKHYVLSNLCKARYGLDSASRREIFIKNNMLIEDEFEYRNNYVSFKFIVLEQKPILLLKHNYGYGSITNWVEGFIKHVNENYLQDIGFDVINDKVSLYYRDAVIEGIPTSYDRVEFADDDIKNPSWISIEAEWFEALWNQHSINETVLSDPIFFEGNEVYTANKKLKEVLLSAKRTISIIDPYMDSSLFSLLEAVDKNIYIRILTSNLQGDSENVSRLFKKERGKIEVAIFKKIHDRFIILDDKYIYLLGSSLNSFGEKATTLVPIDQPKIKEDILHFFKGTWDNSEKKA